MNTAMWIAIALLAPFWWGAGLLLLAMLGDLSPRCRAYVSRLFDRLEGREELPEAAVSATTSC